MPNFYQLKLRTYKIIESIIRVKKKVARETIYNHIFFTFGFGNSICDKMIKTLIDNEIIKEENSLLLWIEKPTIEDEIKEELKDEMPNKN